MAKKEYEGVKYWTSQDGHIFYISINRPKKYNAISYDLFQELENCVEQQVNSPGNDIRVVIFSGEGKHFTAGLDLMSAASMSGSDKEFARRSIEMSDLVLKLQRNVSVFERCKVPVICAMHGFVIGAGVDLSSACDIRLCTKDTKFSIKEVDIGLCADLRTTQRFQKVVGSDSWFRGLSYPARFFDPSEALKHGFVANVYEDRSAMLEAAEKLAREIVGKSPVAIYTIKKSIVYSRDHTVDEGLKHIAILNGAML